MSLFRAIAQNETRQLWRRRTFWIIQGVLVIPALLIRGGLPGTTTLPFLYLVIPILTVPAIIRDQGQVGEILWSSPVDAMAHFSGVLTGLWLGLLPGTFLQLAGWFLADLFIPNSLPGWMWLAGLASILLANTVGLFLATLLATLLRQILAALIGWAALWMWVLLQVNFSEALMESFNPMQRTMWLNFFFHNLRLSPSLGLGLSADRVFGMAAWFLGIGLFAISLALAVSLAADRRRAVRRSRLIPLLALVGVLAAVGGYTANTNAMAAYALHPSPYSPQIDVWKVHSQHTVVEVNAANGLISGKSTLNLTPVQPLEQPEVVLRLNPGLEPTHARDETGRDLAARRLGDSVVVPLPAIPTGSLQLDLAWQGRLQVPYLSFEQPWKHADAPASVKYVYMPQPLKGLLIRKGGYLLRDGDWMPWPWTTGPHLADQNFLAIHPAGGQAVASNPLVNGVATWENDLPSGLLVFLPDEKLSSGRSTLAMSSMAGSQYAEQARLFATAADQFSSLFGERPPRYIAIVPYLSELVWSGELLLVPDGSGHYLSSPVSWLYQKDLMGADGPIVARATLYALLRAWLHDRFVTPELPFQPLLSPEGSSTQYAPMHELTEERWYQDTGHWLQLAEAMDVSVNWTPRRQTNLNPAGKLSALGFWLAMELADAQTRQADLNLIAYFAGEGQSLTSGGARYQLMWDLCWPDILETVQARQLVWDLHEWATEIGPQEAVDIAIAALRELQTGDLPVILAEMEARSGAPILGGQP